MMIPPDRYTMMTTLTDDLDDNDIVQTLLQGGANPDIVNDVR